MSTCNRKTKLLLWFAPLAFVSMLRSEASGAEPKAEINSTVQAVIKILKNPALKHDEAERRQLLRKAIAARFDFRQMAKRSLGPYWHRQTAQQREQFVRLFTDLLEKDYLGRIEPYNREKIVYTGERVSGNHAEVDSKIVTPRGREYPLDYRLLQTGHDWKIYDVIVDNISLLNNYRSRFNDVIDRYSYRELVRRMEKKLS